MSYNNKFNTMPTSSRPMFAHDYSYDYHPPYSHFGGPPQHYPPSHYNGRGKNFYPGGQIPHPRDRPAAPSAPPKNQNTSQNNRERTNTNIIQDNFKAYTCPGCSLHFDCLSRNNRYTGRVPLVLNCRHTVCQECIYKSAIAGEIICSQCKKPSELTKKHNIDNLQEVFPPNYYLFGIIMWAKPQGGNCKPLALVPTQVTLNNRKVASKERPVEQPLDPAEKCCFFSCKKAATLRCQDCSDIYCVDCCTVVHKSAKSLWSHVQVQISSSSFSTELDMCAEHSMDIEFFCKTCEKGACCYCFIEKHEGHEREYLSKLNDVELNEFHTYREKAKQVLKQLLISQKKVKNLNSGGDTSALESRVCNYFADLHATFYSIEKNLQKQLLSQGGIDPESGLESINTSLDSSISTLKLILSSAETLNVKKINLRGLLQKLKAVTLTPCYLLTEDGASTDSVEFEVNPVLDVVDQLFKIKKTSSRKYSLVSTDDLPMGYTPDPLDSQFESDAESCISSLLQSTKNDETLHSRKAGSQSGVSSKQSLQSYKKKSNGRTIGKHMETLSDNEMVEVTHIESLECFYIQLKKAQTRFHQMNKDIENYIKIAATKVENPQIGELYLALHGTKEDKMWCRGRLNDVKMQELETLYELFFIDYGSTHILPINKLREITQGLAQRKPFALQCELYNPTYACWNKNAHVHMGKMINSKEVYLLVKNINNGIYQVDLLVSSSDRGLTSIVDMLMYTCSDVLASEEGFSVQKRETFIPECKIFTNSVKFCKNQTDNVIIANVVDPHHIFVHMASYVDSLKKMISQMRHHYKNTTNESCIPIEGTYVVVEYKDPIRGHWHRALIKKIDIMQAKAHVLLVDWGINVVVPWTSIRLLHDVFTKLEIQAIVVKLAHIEPYQRQHAWSEKATMYLEKYIRTQEIVKMVVQNVDPLEVALFEPSDSVDICINAQLVQEKLADSVGKIAQTVAWPQNNREVEDECFVATLLNKLDKSPETSEEEDPDVENLVKQKINIVKVVSPDLIFIKFLYLEKQESKLHKELQIHYQKECQTKPSWREGEDCVVPFTNYFVRGKILGQSDGKYKVNVYDKVTEVVLPVEKIYVYTDYFRKYPNIVYRARLARIRPAGGDKWSLSSIEALEKTFEKYKEIQATKVQGEMINKAVPMLMWYSQVKVLGALEPFVVKFVSINNLLVKLGFAYKIQPDNGGEKTEGEKTEKVEVVTSAIVHATSSRLDQSVESASWETLYKEKSQEVGEEEESEPLNDKVTKPTSGFASDHTTTSSDWNDIVEEEERQAKEASQQDSPYHVREAEIPDWKPAFAIKKREFNAWVTCADTEGILYIRDEDLQEVYINMQKNLKEYFDNRPPMKETHEWKPGQLCTISHKDYWYRGKILKVNSPTDIIAVMIDFGSDHSLTPKKLCREILYPEIPAFASKIKLDRVFAKSGVWLSSDYDTFLDIVTEYAKIVIKGSLDVDVPLAEVFTDKGQSVNQMLVSMCRNLTNCLHEEVEAVEDDSVVIEKEEEDTLIVEVNEKSEFTVEPLPVGVLNGKTVMSVVGVLAYNKVVLKQVKDVFDELFSITERIQASYASQPVLTELTVGAPCICPYSEDGIWYRAQIYNVDGLNFGYVFVLFVDFGNVESVPVKDIRKMKSEWFELPISCYVATLNVELRTENHLEHVLVIMKKLFGKDKLVEFVSEEPLKVNLYEENGEFCYQSLIDAELLAVK